MIEKIKYLNVQSGYYESEAKIDLFDRVKNKAVLIYGKNGSGKTSLSDALLDKLENIESNSSAIFFDENNNELPDIKYSVYNEKFVDTNIKFSSNETGMNAIVLFGKAEDIDDMISKQNEIILKEEELIKERNIDKFSKKNDEKCIAEKEYSLKAEIKKGWQFREKDIRKTKSFPQLKDEVYGTIINNELVKKESLSEVVNEYNELFKKIEKINSNEQELPVISLTITEFTNEVIINKLITKYVLGSDTELTEIIKKTMLKTGNEYIEKTKELNPNEHCPLCFQKITKEYKNDLLFAFEVLFNDTIKNAILDLKKTTIDKIEFSFPDIFLNKLPAKCVNDLIIKINEYNSTVEHISYLIKRKIDNITEPIIDLNIDIDQIKALLKEKLDLVNEEIQKYNDLIRKYKKNVYRLQELNILRTYLENKEEINTLLKLVEERDYIISQNEKSVENILATRKIIDTLNSKKKNYIIALDEINEDLTYIFTSKKRLYLTADKDPSKYNVYSNGKKIKLSKLSVGERNVIGLCYFFEKLKQECNKEQYFMDEQLIILDDPISSFDYENKLGIYSFLKKSLNEFYKGNVNNRIIILSHEFEVLNCFSEILSDISILIKENEIICKRLNNKTTCNLILNKNSNYQFLLEETFKFANGEVDNETIGNTIRKLIESYATFNYKLGMAKFFQNDNILSKINNEKLKKYFENRMYRLVLNSSSHTEISTKSYPDIFNFELFSKEEKIQTAKDIIVLLYCLDPEHIKSYFLNGNDVTSIIDSWLNDLISICE